MSKSICRIGDISSGACGLPPTPIISNCSQNVIVNNKAAALIGSGLPTHSAGNVTHTNRIITSGSSKVIINGKAAASIGSSISCGDIMTNGSESVLVG
jgi:uncharacterized Zn-binding protein involved in type VI secretion